MKIPFNNVYNAKNTAEYLAEVANSRHWSGDGAMTKWCHNKLKDMLGVRQALLTPSGTAALEMASLLLDLKPGDEVILPSFTFSSTANSFLLQGAVPVFVDIRKDTINVDENLIEQAITKKTRAVLPVHYAGVACEMDKINEVCKANNILVIEDAAHAIGALYKGRKLGTVSDMAAFSFHETKNIISGEGGAFLTDNQDLAFRAEILREKGTNRSQFFRGEVDKYTWKDKGSSFLPSEFQSAVLKAQLESYDFIQATRMDSWNNYHKMLEALEKKGYLRRPVVPESCIHNAHLYYILVDSLDTRTKLSSYLKENGIASLFHYVPLHQSPAGLKYGRVASSLENTIMAGDCLLRLPLWIGLNEELVAYVVGKIESFFKTHTPAHAAEFSAAQG